MCGNKKFKFTGFAQKQILSVFAIYDIVFCILNTYHFLPAIFSLQFQFCRVMINDWGQHLVILIWNVRNISKMSIYSRRPTIWPNNTKGGKRLLKTADLSTSRLCQVYCRWRGIFSWDWICSSNQQHQDCGGYDGHYDYNDNHSLLSFDGYYLWWDFTCFIAGDLGWIFLMRSYSGDNS